MVDRWAFIVNPTAGNGFAGEYVSKLREKMAEFKIDGEIVLTERQGHASDLAAEFLSKGFQYIIAVGGDGTFNEMCRPLLNHPRVTVGIVPAGTGNDFVQILGFPDRFKEEHWATFFKHHAIAMDAGTCNGNCFLNGLGIGFDAQVAAENYKDDGQIKKSGKDKYIWHILKTLLFYKELQAEIEYGDMRERSSSFMTTVAIGRRFAGDFFITPKAIANDGLFDVCRIKELSLAQRLKILLAVPKGAHLNDPSVEYFQTDHLRMAFDEKIPYHVDGEIFFDTSFDVQLLPAALNVLYNPHGQHYFNSPQKMNS